MADETIILREDATVVLRDRDVPLIVTTNEVSELKVEHSGAVFNILPDGNYASYLDWPQSSPQTTWMIPHNFGKYPSVQILDQLGEMVLSKVSHLSDDIVQIEFNTPFSGRAILTA